MTCCIVFCMKEKKFPLKVLDNNEEYAFTFNLFRHGRFPAAIISEHCVAASIQLGQDFVQRSLTVTSIITQSRSFPST